MPKQKKKYIRTRRRKSRRQIRKTRRIRGGDVVPPTPLPESFSTPAPRPPPTSPPNEKKKTILMLEQAQDLARENDPGLIIRFPTQLNQAVKKLDKTSVFNNDEMVKGLGNKDFMNLLFEDTDTTNFRKLMEKLSASKQCQAVLGPCPNPCICWLCGQVIENETPECEHILPISRTILFSGLKSTKKIETQNIQYGQEPRNIINEYHNLSYDYAHPGCNKKKSDKVLITWDNTTGKIVFDASVAYKLADEIIQVQKNAQKDILIQKYREKIEKLVEPINAEIQTILSIEGATMDLYWAYTLNIMKYYVLYEYLLQNRKISETEIKNIEQEKESLNKFALTDAKTDIETYRKELQGVKKNLMSLFTGVSKPPYPPYMQRTSSITVKRKLPIETVEPPLPTLKRTITAPTTASNVLPPLPPPPQKNS